MKVGVGYCVFLVAFLAMAFGCSRTNDVPVAAVTDRILELESRVDVSSAVTNAILLLDKLVPDDVIVAVNGYPLRKRTYDDMMTMRAKGLMSQPNANQLVVQKQLEQYRSSLIRNFIGQRLMIDNAFELNVVTTNDVVNHVRSELNKAARRRKKTVDAFLRSFPSDSRYFLYEMAASYVMGTLIDKKIPPIAPVDQKFVEGVQESVRLENEAAQKTNEMIRARLADWKRQIEAKKLDFGQVANAFSHDRDAASGLTNGFWGTFEEPEMDNPKIAAAVFSLPRGAISDPLEDDDGFHLVKVMNVIPPARNEKGRVVSRERRELSHIYIEKLPLLLTQTDEALTDDLKGQFQARAINLYVAKLQTNGVNKVVYPHGKPIYHQ